MDWTWVEIFQHAFTLFRSDFYLFRNEIIMRLSLFYYYFMIEFAVSTNWFKNITLLVFVRRQEFPNHAQTRSSGSYSFNSCRFKWSLLLKFSSECGFRTLASTHILCSWLTITWFSSKFYEVVVDLHMYGHWQVEWRVSTLLARMLH
jgi:hypothetical protein